MKIHGVLGDDVTLLVCFTFFFLSLALSKLVLHSLNNLEISVFSFKVLSYDPWQSELKK